MGEDRSVYEGKSPTAELGTPPARGVHLFVVVIEVSLVEVAIIDAFEAARNQSFVYTALPFLFVWVVRRRRVAASANTILASPVEGHLRCL